MYSTALSESSAEPDHSKRSIRADTMGEITNPVRPKIIMAMSMKDPFRYTGSHQLYFLRLKT